MLLTLGEEMFCSALTERRDEYVPELFNAHQRVAGRKCDGVSGTILRGRKHEN